MATNASCNYITMNAHLDPPNNVFSPYTLGLFIRATIFEEGVPANQYFQGTQVISYNTSLQPWEAQARAVIAALTAMASIAPDPEGTWAGEANATIAAVTTWAYALVPNGDPSLPGTLALCFNQDVPALFGTMPGDTTPVQVNVDSIQANETAIPVPFYDQIQQYLEDNDNEFNLLVEMFKGFE